MEPEEERPNWRNISHNGIWRTERTCPCHKDSRIKIELTKTVYRKKKWDRRFHTGCGLISQNQWRDLQHPQEKDRIHTNIHERRRCQVVESAIHQKRYHGHRTWSWDMDFITKVRDTFAPYDAPGDALEEITNLKMGTTPIDDHIARYQILLDWSGVPRDSPSAIDYFRRTLNIPLQRKLLDLPTPPKNLKEWYKWAARLHNNFRKMQRILRTPHHHVNT